MAAATTSAAPPQPGLRERKKLQTERRLWVTAIQLFEERGFAQVSVAEIAAAADVSKVTVFNYFRTKEDLVMRPLEWHTDEPARVVRERADGQSAVTALRTQFLEALDQFDPATGLNDQEQLLGVARLIRATPSLLLRAQALSMEAEEALADELIAQSADHDPLIARLAAAQLTGARRVLVEENQRRLLAGESCVKVLPEARANAVHAFAVVEQGLGGYCVR